MTEMDLEEWYFSKIHYRTQHPATASLPNFFGRKRNGRQKFFLCTIQPFVKFMDGCSSARPLHCNSFCPIFKYNRLQGSFWTTGRLIVAAVDDKTWFKNPFRERFRRAKCKIFRVQNRDLGLEHEKVHKRNLYQYRSPLCPRCIATSTV